MLKSLSYRVKKLRFALLAQRYRLPGGYRRIYHYHVRKTGGTSLNHIFLSLSGEDGKNVYHQLVGTSDHRVEVNGKIFVGWNKGLIEEGNYFYGFSHIPAHELTLPSNTYTITCFRDPVKRIISHYKMLLDHKASDNPHISFEREKLWMGDTLVQTAEQMPKETLLRQLYMFSEDFDIDTALLRVQQCSQVLFLEELNDGLQQVGKELRMNLHYQHLRRSVHNYDPTPAEIEYLREKLAPEYDFINRLRIQLQA